MECLELLKVSYFQMQYKLIKDNFGNLEKESRKEKLDSIGSYYRPRISFILSGIYLRPPNYQEDKKYMYYWSGYHKCAKYCIPFVCILSFKSVEYHLCK